MSEIVKTTITSTEAAEWCGKEHSKLLRDIRNYISQLGEAKIGFSDFFTETTYQTEQNKTLPCFMVTKKGCEFTAHKMTGQKGTEFTARYINRFHEMEEEKQVACPIDSATLKGLAASGNLIRSTMKDEKAKPYEVAIVLDSLFRQSGVDLPDCFIKIPEYEQMTLTEFMK